MKQTFSGSCHCGAVRFEADVDLAAGSRRCNCSYCAKTRYWKAFVGVDDIRLLCGTEVLGDYRAPASVWSPDHIHHRFCTKCGVQLYSLAYLADWGGWFHALNIAAVDGIDQASLAAIPIVYEDGIADRQLERPAVIAHL
jgi:hypothetical protein